jgi:nucleoside-diphosphate-sugar epimerase
MMSERAMALVLGATGGIGGEMARGLIARGWRVRALARDPDGIRVPIPGVAWVRGDAMDGAAVSAAAEGAALIVHGVNPPRYRNWRALALPMLRNTIAAARRHGARVFFPGTVYNFGPETFGPMGASIGEDAPQRPRTRKGAIRVEMETALREAAAEGVRVVILRGGDFFGPRSGVANSWFSGAVVKPGKPVTAITYPGPPGIGHAWAYLPDFAQAALRLIERDAELPAFSVFHFAGHWLDHAALAGAVREAAGVSNLPVRRFPWWLVWLAAPFVPMLREMLEMTYLWRVPLRLDNRRLVALLGAEPHTPAVEAVRATLVGLGCLQGDGRPAVRAGTPPCAVSPLP